MVAGFIVRSNMRRLIILLTLTGAAFAVLIAADGPLTNGANLPVRTDANGYLMAAAQTYTGPDGPRRPLANTLVRTDANGYLIITNPSGFGGGGAPTTALYWLGAANATLTNGKDLSALTTGLVLNTSGTPSAYAGATCTAGQAVASLDASGVATCATVSADQATILIRTSMRF